VGNWDRVSGPARDGSNLATKVWEAMERLERENEAKTAAVHFVRVEVPPAMREKLRRGAKLTIGVDHPEYRAAVDASAEQRASLLEDLK
jgi:hypothetical protein